MANNELLPSAVLRRKAVVYVRQSTQAQVQTNLEGPERVNDFATPGVVNLLSESAVPGW